MAFWSRLLAGFILGAVTLGLLIVFEAPTWAMSALPFVVFSSVVDWGFGMKE